MQLVCLHLKSLVWTGLCFFSPFFVPVLTLNLYFSQSLVNLLVTGHAVSNVWDGDRECSGMSMTFSKSTYTQPPLRSQTPNIRSSVAPGVQQRAAVLHHTMTHKHSLIPTGYRDFTRICLFPCCRTTRDSQAGVCRLPHAHGIPALLQGTAAVHSDTAL